MHRLAIPAIDAGWNAAGAGPLAAGFVLTVDRSVPEGPVPARHALAAGSRLLETVRGSLPYRAAVAALACHLLLLAGALYKPGMFWPAPPPTRELMGLEDGSVEVSVISANALDRLHSGVMQREAVPSEEPPAETPPAPPPEPPPAPPQRQAEAVPDPLPAPSQSKGVKSDTYDPSAFAEMASNAFTSEITGAFRMAEARRHNQQQQQQQTQRESVRMEARSGAISASRPGASHKGRSDPFAKDVIWALAATKPMGNGKYGTIVVTFTVSDSGQLEGLRLVKSAGDKWLDQAVMMSVKQARMPKPPEPLPHADRTFVVNYISQEGR
jgi:periplasmic protein TonB